MSVSDEATRVARYRRDWVADHVMTVCDERRDPVQSGEVVAVVMREFGCSDVTARKYIKAAVDRMSLMRVRGCLWPRLAGRPPDPAGVLFARRVGSSLYVRATA